MRSTRQTTVALAALAVSAAAVASAGTAVAISGGGYQPHQMGCAIKADSNNREERKQPKGCHDVNLLVQSGGHTYVQVGTNTTEEGNNVHSGDIMVSPDGSGSPTGKAVGKSVTVHFDTHYQPIPENQCGLFDLLTYPVDLLSGSECKLDPAKWRLPSKLPSVTPKLTNGNGKGGAPSLTHAEIYFGADDGLDTGEHDEPNGKNGTKKEQNGPSDGGAITAKWHPLAVINWLSAALNGLEHGSFAPIARNPIPVFSTGFGACADGICISVQSARTQSLRGGGGGGENRDAYNYQGKTFDPYNCSGESPAAEKQCHDATHKNEDAFLAGEARHVWVEPGVQVYEDPDPNGSPLLPTYPLPAAYAGTCGLVLGGGPIKVPNSPLTNKAHQLVLSPTHC